MDPDSVQTTVAAATVAVAANCVGVVIFQALHEAYLDLTPQSSQGFFFSKAEWHE